MVPNIFDSFLLWPGDVCMKDINHCVHHSPRHRSACANAKDDKRLSATERAIWTQRGTMLGWCDPTFAHVSVAKVPRGVAPAHSPSLRPLNYTAAIG